MSVAYQNKNAFSDEKMIVAENDSYSFWKRVGETDKQKSNLDFSFNGISTIWELSTDKDVDIVFSTKSRQVF